jgi:hypothetical protein
MLIADLAVIASVVALIMAIGRVVPGFRKADLPKVC